MPSDKKALTLSLIIPAYNEQNHIRACLESIASQSVMPDEVIIVDNNSTDQTRAIAEEYPFVKIIDEKKQGIVHARNRGFSAAKCEIIGRIDADTILPEGWVRKVKNFYDVPDHCSYALTGGGYFYNIRLKRFNGWFQSQLAFRLNRLVIGHHILWGSNMALPKEAWGAVKTGLCEDDDIHEDMDLGIHLNTTGYKIAYRPALRVGVMLKRVYSGRKTLHMHMARWPNTLHRHGYSLWWMGTVGNIFLWYVAQPLIYTVEYFNRLILRRKPLGD